MFRFVRRNSVSLLIGWSVCLCLLYLWPFRFIAVTPPFFINDAAWLEAQPGVTFRQNGKLVTATPPVGLHDELVRGDGLTVEAVLTPAAGIQTGPARIVSYSDGLGSRNFTLGQEQSDLVFRLRTVRTDPNGVLYETRVPDVFATAGRAHIVVTYDFTTLNVLVDGQRRATLDRPQGNFANWDRDQHLILGNESSGDRPWKGTIAAVALYDRAIAPDDVLRNFRRGGPDADSAVIAYDFTGSLPEGDLRRPAIYPNGSAPALLGLASRRPADFAFGFVAFSVLGALVAISAGRQTAGTRRVVIVSIIMVWAGATVAESLQFVVEGRTSSILDLTSALAGGAAGVLVAYRWRRVGPV